MDGPAPIPGHAQPGSSARNTLKPPKGLASGHVQPQTSDGAVKFRQAAACQASYNHQRQGKVTVNEAHLWSMGQTPCQPQPLPQPPSGRCKSPPLPDEIATRKQYTRSRTGRTRTPPRRSSVLPYVYKTAGSNGGGGQVGMDLPRSCNFRTTATSDGLASCRRDSSWRNFAGFFMILLAHRNRVRIAQVSYVAQESCVVFPLGRVYQSFRQFAICWYLGGSPAQGGAVLGSNPG